MAFRKSENYAVQLNFKDDPELYQILNRYKNSLGWTWKRTLLVGFANTVSKNGDNPELVLRIADYLEGKR